MVTLTIKEAEKIRENLGLNIYEFSHRLGYSATAYKYALQKNRISRWMAREISARFGRVLSEVRN